MNEFYTLQEVANILHCSTTTVYNFERKGLIKRLEDPHNLRSATRFYRAGVDQLNEEKKILEGKGKSITEVAKELGVYPSKIKEVIESLQLEVESIPLNIGSIAQRYSITPEQEEQIVHFLLNQKVPRPKRNHFYWMNSDLALHQAFRLAGAETVRLKVNKQNVQGFVIGEEEFVPYLVALKNMDIEPLYPIHQPRNRTQSGFTDIEVPVGRKAFYQILDALYAICGVENFNAEIRTGKACFSVRNGRYPINAWATAEALTVIQEHIKSGEVEAVDGAWHFNRTSMFVQLEFETEDYASIKQFAKEAGISPREWIHQAISEKQSISTKN